MSKDLTAPLKNGEDIKHIVNIIFLKDSKDQTKNINKTQQELL